MKRIITFCALVTLLFAVCTQADVLEVGPAGGGAGILGDIHVYPFSTIQAAIDFANPGDTIIVHQGTYEEDLVVGVDNLTIMSQDGNSVTIIKGVANVDKLSWPLAVPNIEITGSGVEIYGFTIQGPNNVLDKYSSGMVIGGDNVSIHDNIFQPTNANSLDEISQAIQTYRDSGAGDLGGLNIYDNKFEPLAAGTHGIEAIFINHTLSDPTPAGAVTIQNNVITGAVIRGITTERSNVAITGNTVETSLDPFDSLVGAFQGILVMDFSGRDQQDVTVTNNTVQGFSGFNQGVRIGTAGQALSGISIQNNSILSNNIGVQVRSAAGVAVNNNKIVGNTVGLENTDTVELDATNNWWNDAAGPYHPISNPDSSGDEVSSLVDYDPWCTDENCGASEIHPVVNVTQGISYSTIMGAIVEANPNDQITVAAGVYDETLDIDGMSGLDIIGEDKDTTIIKSSTTIGLNVGGYGETRQTMIRIVYSTDILIENVTIDCDLIKGNNSYGVFGWDSEVTLNNNILKNASVDDLSGGYGDITTYFRTENFDAVTRAQVSITNCTFIDPGRLAILTHDYINIDVSGNTFYKTFDDFGYAMEIGSQSTGQVIGNTIYGYDIPAASDGSSSAGIYIENSFTGSAFGGSPHVDKDVLVQGNEIYDCQYAMTIGNEWNTYAGDVDIQVDLQGNNYHDNVSGGIIVADEDAEDGSSVTITGSGNTIVDCNEFAYFVYTFGDGDITIDLSDDTLTGNQYGMYVGDYPSGTSTSIYSIDVSCSDLSGNSEYGIFNDVADTTNATLNWWGDASGPAGVGGGSGSAVSANVDYFPWLLSNDCGNIAQVVADYVVDDDWAPLPPFTQVFVNATAYYIGLNAFDTIQGAVDAASDGNNISVAAGTYNEAVLIEKSLNIRGATADLNKNGYPVPENYAWDPDVESIINHPDPAAGYLTIVDIHDVNDVTFQGFVVQELYAEGNKNSSLLRVYAHTQEISGINVINNVIGGNTNIISQDGTHGRMGLYIVNHPYDDKGVVNSTFAGNKIFDCKGNGDNIFLWTSYYAYGAPGPASMMGTVIEDNEIYGSHRAGIETAGGYSDLVIRHNKIYANSGLPTDDPNHLKYGNGILLIRGSSDKLGDATTAYGPVNVTIKGNEIFSNEKNGIYSGPIINDVSITGNEFYDNGWDAVRVDLEGTYWNPTFEPEPNDWSVYDAATDVEVSYNNIFANGAGVELIGIPVNGLIVDAEYNWWGDVSGPSDPVGTDETDGTTCADVSVIKNADGIGDGVSENVDYCTWLTAPVMAANSACPAGDLDFDCDVDFADIAVLANNWLAGTE